MTGTLDVAKAPSVSQALGRRWWWGFALWLVSTAFTLFLMARSFHYETRWEFRPLGSPGFSRLELWEYLIKRDWDLNLQGYYAYWWPKLLLVVLLWGIVLVANALVVCAGRSAGNSPRWQTWMSVNQIMSGLFLLVMCRGAKLSRMSVDIPGNDGFLITPRVFRWSGDAWLDTFLVPDPTQLYARASLSFVLLVASLLMVKTSYRTRAVVAGLTMPVAALLVVLLLGFE